jgi:hypothetical protein
VCTTSFTCLLLALLAYEWLDNTILSIQVIFKQIGSGEMEVCETLPTGDDKTMLVSSFTCFLRSFTCFLTMLVTSFTCLLHSFTCLLTMLVSSFTCLLHSFTCLLHSFTCLLPTGDDKTIARALSSVYTSSSRPHALVA